MNKDIRSAPIGVFDSGVGGLTVVAEVFKKLPAESVIYLGDTARYPYGPRSAEIVQRFALQGARFLMGFGIKALLVACNTASSVALDVLRRWISVPIFGVVLPGARAAVRASRKKRIGVIGTVGTINSGAYQRAIAEIDGDAEVFAKACPLFVPLAEEGWHTGPVVEAVAHHYLDDLVARGIDTLVLGCTHYPLLVGAISRVVGGEVAIVDSASAVASELRAFLEKEGLLCGEGSPSARFFVTDAPERFAKVGENFLGRSLASVERVNIDL